MYCQPWEKNSCAVRQQGRRRQQAQPHRRRPRRRRVRQRRQLEKGMAGNTVLQRTSAWDEARWGVRWRRVMSIHKLIAMAVVSLVPAPTPASEEVPGTVLQPIISLDAVVAGYPVTFTYRGDVWASPGSFVMGTLSRNMIATENGFENRNAASLAGLTMELVPRPLPLGANECHGL